MRKNISQFVDNSIANFHQAIVVFSIFEPDFQAITQTGKSVEACNLRDNYQIIREHGVEILGVSPGSEASHQKFVEKYVLPFDLIPDIEKKIIRDYGAWG